MRPPGGDEDKNMWPNPDIDFDIYTATDGTGLVAFVFFANIHFLLTPLREEL